jgi:hypothetical protein
MAGLLAERTRQYADRPGAERTAYGVKAALEWPKTALFHLGASAVR